MEQAINPCLVLLQLVDACTRTDPMIGDQLQSYDMDGFMLQTGHKSSKSSCRACYHYQRMRNVANSDLIKSHDRIQVIGILDQHYMCCMRTRSLGR